MRTIVSVFGLEPVKISGTEAYARELSLQLGQLGWKSVLCFECEPTKAVRDYLNLPNVEIEVVPEICHVRARNLRELTRVLKRYRPEILHLHLTGFLSPFPWLARCYSVQKVFFTDHTSRPASYIGHRAAFWKRAAVRMINYPVCGVFCGSGYGLDCFTKLDLLPAERFTLVYNSVDFDRLKQVDPDADRRLRQTYSIPEESLLVVQLSWVIPEKGIEDFLEAARLIVEHEKNVHFLLVGEGSHRERYTRLAEEMGLKGHVSWSGLVEDPFREGCYEAADVVCQVSRWQELFGYTIAEAMASSKPVVATRVGGIPELVQDGVTGFLVPPQAPEQIAAKVSLLLGNEELRRKMGRAGRAVAAAKFDIKRNVAQVLAVYGLARNGNPMGGLVPSPR